MANLSTYILIGSIVIMALFVGIGFLRGFFRGFMRESIRLVWFIVLMCIVIPFIPMIADAVMGIHVGGDSLRNHLMGMFPFSDGSSGYASVADALVTGIGGVAIFLVCFFLCKWISLIFYGLTKRYLPKPKEVVVFTAPNLGKESSEQRSLANRAVNEQFNGDVYEPSRNVVKKVKLKNNHRLLGGLLGVIAGFAFYILTFMPLNGIVSTYSSLLNSSEVVSAEVVLFEDENQTYAEVFGVDDILDYSISGFLNDLIPEEVGGWNVKKGILDYQNSFPAKISNFFGLSDLLFDLATKTSVNGEKIFIRREILAADKFYTHVQQVLSQNAPTLYKNWNWDGFEALVNEAFDIAIVRSVVGPSLQLINEELVAGSDLSIEFYNAFADIIEQGYTAVELKAEVQSLLEIVKGVAESGLADACLDVNKNGIDEERYNDILEILEKEDYTVIRDFSENLFGGKILKAFWKAEIGVLVQDMALKNENNNPTSMFDADNYDATRMSTALASQLISFVEVGNTLPFSIIEPFFSPDLPLFTADPNFDFGEFLTAVGPALDKFHAFPIPVRGVESSFYSLVIDYFTRGDDPILGEFVSYFDLVETKSLSYSFAAEINSQKQSLIDSYRAAVDVYENVEIEEVGGTGEPEENNLFDNTEESNAKLAYLEDLLTNLQTNAYNADGNGKQGLLKKLYLNGINELLSQFVEGEITINFETVTWTRYFQKIAALKQEIMRVDEIMNNWNDTESIDGITDLRDTLNEIADLFEDSPDQLQDFIDMAKGQIENFPEEISDMSVETLREEIEVANTLLDFMESLEEGGEVDEQQIADQLLIIVTGGSGYILDSITDPANNVHIDVAPEKQSALANAITGLTTESTGKDAEELAELQAKLNTLFGF